MLAAQSICVYAETSVLGAVGSEICNMKLIRVDSQPSGLLLSHYMYSHPTSSTDYTYTHQAALCTDLVHDLQ